MAVIAVANPPRRKRRKAPGRPQPRDRDLSVPLMELVTNARVRHLAGGVTRHTLLRWRTEEQFPPPVLETDGVELWDAREVRAWLRSRQ